MQITTTDGNEYTLIPRNLLEGIDENRLAIFVFDSGQIYEGFTDGEVDEDYQFCLSRPGAKVSIGLPYYRLIGYAYVKK